MSRIFTVEELAKELRVSDRTIRRAANDGSLPSFRFTEGGKLLFEEEAIRSWIRRGERRRPQSFTVPLTG